MNLFQILFLVLLFAANILDFALNILNRNHVIKNAHEIPEPFKEKISKEEYTRSVNYTLANINFGFVTSIFDLFWDCVKIFFLYAFLFTAASDFLSLDSSLSTWSIVWREGVIMVAIVTVLSWVELPFDAYSTFKIEADFGFNKSSLKLWIMDNIKGLFVGLLITLPICWGIVALYHAFPSSWWIFAQCGFFAVQLFLIVLYPKLILPLFNKLSPLPQGELRERLEALAKRAGFIAEKIEVIDSSKRSGHSNAYFTGIGKWRRIVLYDTLIEQLSPEEIEAVLAHEIGHSKRGHITKHLITSFFTGFLPLGVCAWLLYQKEFFEAFGFEFRENLMLIPMFLIGSTLLPLIKFFIVPILNHLSRKHEYEADAFAKKMIGSPEALISALHKLHKENLSNLTPHPLYRAFNYSHPALKEREDALRKN